jgi:hypothetical protein
MQRFFTFYLLNLLRPLSKFVCGDVNIMLLYEVASAEHKMYHVI